jgi:glycosyltransferase involved in cell wall biosynthesis
MNILFVHQNFPGQFKHLAPALEKKGHNVNALAMYKGNDVGGHVSDISVTIYSPRRGTSENIHPLAVDFETKIIRGEACSIAAEQLRGEGYTPDLIVAHPGWGESLFLKEVWPSAKLLIYCEFYYSTTGQDVGFDPEFTDNSMEEARRVQLKNTNNVLHFEQADAGLCPTYWQASTFPSWFQGKMSVIFDGIDTDAVHPNPQAELYRQGNRVVGYDDEVITFINRSLEPYRGYHIFMRALPALLRTRPKAKVLIVGRDDVSYGKAPESGSWKQIFINEVKKEIPDEDMKRVHFLGNIPYETFKKVLQVSSLHIYHTYPFVLSWSLLEAMAAGCCILASNTAPVSEVITDGDNGVLIDFFDIEGLVSKADSLLNDTQLRLKMGQKARETILKKYDLNKICLPAQIQLVEGLCS